LFEIVKESSMRITKMKNDKPDPFTFLASASKEQMDGVKNMLLKLSVATPVRQDTLAWVLMMVLLRRAGGEIPLLPDEVDAIVPGTTYVIDQSADPIVIRIVKKGTPGAEIEPEDEM
jgi:hypothetical protein